jgi:site-specific DNA-methyltransferase (adenine-specific)
MKPYYQKGGITIYLGDCLEIMPRLDGPFNAIISDWPYGVTSCKWDSVIPLEPLWKECKRLSNLAVLFGSQPFTSQLVMSNLEWFRHELIWEKDGGAAFILSGHRPNHVHESILVFSSRYYHPNAKNKATYNPIVFSGRKATLAETTKYREKSKRLNDISYRPNPTKQITYPKDGTYLRSVLYFKKDRPVLHHTQKPVKLLSILVRTYTNPGDIILDNTCGSGTTLVAAQNEGRRCVGIEISEEYCRIAVDRLRQPSFWSIPENNEVTVTQAAMDLTYRGEQTNE